MIDPLTREPSGSDTLGWSEQLLDAAPDAMLVVGSDQNIAFVNARAEELFGYSRSELLGQSLDRLIPNRLRAGHGGHVARYFAQPTARAMGSGRELSGCRKDGMVLLVEVSLSPVMSPAGMMVCAAVRDISDRKRIEAAAKTNALRLSSALESIEDALALYDADDRLVLCNNAYRQLVGRLLPGSLIGQPYAEVLGAWLAGCASLGEPERQRLVDQTAGRLEPRRFDVRATDGRSYRVIDRPAAESGIVQTIWDLSEDTQREQELHDARRAAEAASAAKSEFLSSMSHELRTPLNAILGFAQLLQRDKKSPLSDRHRERIDHILKGGEHLLQLIDEILDLSRIEAGRILVSAEPVSLPAVLAEVRSTLEPMAARAEIQLVIESVPDDVPEVIADRTRLKQVLMNYGSNAIKYGRKGGRAVLAVERSGAYVRITVSDDGIGIASEKHDKLFQPFQRAGQETGSIQGTGIGLAITKRLAELMAGRVGFESGEGRGSRFWIELPARDASAVAASSGAASHALGESPLAATTGPRFCIVYVEDNPSNIAFMSDLLSDLERIELLTAPTAEIGIELIRARKPHAVIMDINLPGMSGIEATEKLGQWPETREIPVIALSAAAMPGDAQRAHNARFHRFLTKPVSVDELTAALEELLCPD